MSAETLRAAAAALRERANEAPSGPWGVDDMNDDTVIAIGMTDDGFDDMWEDVARVEDAEVAPYIATMHPGVGLALANMLDEAASGYLVERGYASDHLVIIAQLILGGAS